MQSIKRENLYFISCKEGNGSRHFEKNAVSRFFVATAKLCLFAVRIIYQHEM